MAVAVHSYGPSCTLHEEYNQFTRKASTLSDEPPKIKPHFFYSSTLPIDDPLSPLPPPSTSTSSSFPYRPFSTYDNVALEEAWQGLQQRGNKGGSGNSKVHGYGVWCHHVDPKSEKSKGQNLVKIVKDIGASSSAAARIDKIGKEEIDHNEQSKLSAVTPSAYCSSPIDHPVELDEVASHSPEHMPLLQQMAASPQVSVQSDMLVGTELLKDDAEPESYMPTTVSTVPTSESTESQDESNPHVLLCDDLQHVPSEDYMPIASEEVVGNESELDSPERQHRSIFHRRSSHRKEKAGKSNDKKVLKTSRSTSWHRSKVVTAQYGSSPSERQTTGTPFLRAPSPSHSEVTPQYDGTDSARDSEGGKHGNRSPIFNRLHSIDPKSELEGRRQVSPLGRKEDKAYVPVGISRLHLVVMPDLEMKPIYWRPIHDISCVVRGTWFYKETMLPVEPDIANRLEEGYEYMRPWTIAYNDEVKSCLEIGPEAELKIVYNLWPPEQPKDIRGHLEPRKKGMFAGKSNPELLTPEEKARKHAAEMASSRANKAVGALTGRDSGGDTPQLYPKSSVIYANARDAQILRPALLPSFSRGRSPLGPICKGRVIGIPVVRGFDQKAWDKLHPQKKSFSSRKAHAAAVASQSGAAATVTKRDACPACLCAEDRPKVTDLVLVIHGYVFLRKLTILFF